MFQIWPDQQLRAASNILQGKTHRVEQGQNRNRLPDDLSCIRSMTALALDVRGPLVVVVGAFNPAIFTPNWIATHIFGVPEGDEISVLEVVTQIDHQTFLRLSFISGVAVNVGPNRIELFSSSGREDAFPAVETALAKILKALPHTPVNGLGCNFRWMDSDPSQEVIDLFDSPEGIEGKYKLLVRQSSSQIELDGAILNFARAATASGDVQFSFNYHRSVGGAAECAVLIDGAIARDLAHSTEMMQSLYGYTEHSVLEYNAAEQQGEIANAAEIVN